MKVEMVEIEKIKPYEKNPRKNQNAEKIAKSLEKYGWRQPIVVDKDYVVIVGHTRLMASKELGLKKVPVLKQKLSQEQTKALRIADNRLNEDSEWDYFLLGDELKELLNLKFDLQLTGFEKTELENLLDFDTENDDYNAFPMTYDSNTEKIYYNIPN